MDSPSFAFITWTFNDGVNKAINIVTLSPSSVNVAKPYQGRVVVNQTNGFVTLMSLKAEDSGDYTINIISDAGTLTDDIQLRVLCELHLSSHLPCVLYRTASLFLFQLFCWGSHTCRVAQCLIKIQGKVCCSTSDACRVTENQWGFKLQLF